LEIERDGDTVPLSGRQRALCTVLLLNANRVVPVEGLVRRLWHERPPAAGEARVRSLVAEIRRALGPTGPDVVLTRSPGYLMRAERAQLDLFEFEDALNLGYQAASRGNWTEALHHHERALSLWRGEPFPDLPVSAEARRFVELRTTALEGRVEAHMALGRHGSAIAELARLTQEYPLRERPHELLMRALHEEGRTAEALEVYARLRRRLVGELGVEPSAEIGALQRQLLVGKGRKGQPKQRNALAEEAPAPRQLPPVTPHFVGRKTHLRRLEAWRREGGRLMLIVGPAGAGKTTLALHWAHQVAHHFPDGQLVLDMRGFDTGEPMTPEEALPLLLQGLGREPGDIPVTLDAQVALYRTLLADRAVLVVLDDVADRSQVRQLLPGTARSLTVVTSRSRLSGLVTLDGARSVTCDVLDATDSIELIGNAAGAERVSAEPEAAAQLAHLCGHLPLALCVAASWICDDSPGSISRYVHDLVERGRLARLHVDGDEHVAVRTALDLSYDTLPAIGRRVFRLIGLLPGTGRSASAIAAAAGLGVTELDDAMRTVARVHLVAAAGAGRYTWHDLAHEYAHQRMTQEDTRAERDAAGRRLLDHYLHSMVNAARAAGLYVPQLPLGAPLLGSDPLSFTQSEDVFAWFDAEWGDIASAIGHVAEDGPRRYAWYLVDAMQDFLHHRRPMSDWMRLAKLALTAAQQDDDPMGQAAMHLSLGYALWRVADLKGALSQYESACRLARRAEWPQGEARALHAMGTAVKQLGNPALALSHYHSALSLYRETGYSWGEGSILSNMASAHLVLGDLAQADDALAGALPLTRGRNLHLHALGLVNLGLVRQKQGRLAEAMTALDESLEVSEQTGSSYAKAVTLETAGLVHLDANRYEEAITAFDHAMEIAERVENRNCQVACLVGLATARMKLRRVEEAVEHLAVARVIAEEIGTSVSLAEVLLAQATADRLRGRPQEALAFLARAARIAAEGAPLTLPRVLCTEALVLLDLGRNGTAAVRAREACRVAAASGQRLVQARAMRVLERCHSAMGDTEAAQTERERANSLFSLLGVVEAD
jgi:DNA-binding SARP family transcriptional activator/Tfp pilus assembly protein PilF/energy-coupling factor transporter ATP-binding protein EcfA2